jgi:hypothetical protein
MLNLRSRFKNHVESFLQTQLLLTVISIPILVGSGLPLSIMTIVGNFVFSQVLIIFLVVSSLFFFTQLLHVPNEWIVFVLEKLTDTWDTVLNLGSQDWLLGFAQPSFWFLLSMPIATFFILQSSLVVGAWRRIVVLFFICLTCMFGLQFCSRVIVTPPKEICLQNKLDIKRNNDGSLNITDHGFFNTKKTPDRFVNFEFRQYMIKTFGDVVIAEYVVAKPGHRSFQAAAAVCLTFKVRKLMLPWFKKKLSKGAWRQFFEMKRAAEAKNIVIGRCNCECCTPLLN